MLEPEAACELFLGSCTFVIIVSEATTKMMLMMTVMRMERIILLTIVVKRSSRPRSNGHQMRKHPSQAETRRDWNRWWPGA